MEGEEERGEDRWESCREGAKEGRAGKGTGREGGGERQRCGRLDRPVSLSPAAAAAAASRDAVIGCRRSHVQRSLASC